MNIVAFAHLAKHASVVITMGHVLVFNQSVG